MGQYLKEREKNGGKENVKTQLTLKGKRKEQMKCHIFFLLCKAYERKEYVLVYCKALHFYSKKRYTLLFFLYWRRKCYTLEVEDDNDWASIGIHE